MAATITAGGGVARRALRSAVLPWFVLAIGIPASLMLFVHLETSVENVARLRFERGANDANGIIEGRLRSYSDVLYALRALFATEEHIDRLRFRRFIDSLELKQRYPGFMSLNYAAHVLHSQKERFVDSVRRDTSVDPRGYPNFTIKPLGDRDEYFVVVYLEPLNDYEFAFGLDLGANPMAADPEKVAAAVRLQRDSGKLISSAQPLRLKRPNDPIYLAMRLPVYRNGLSTETVEQRRSAYVGSVGAAFDVEYLMREALNEEMLRYVQIRLFDIGPAPDYPRPDLPPQRRLLFDSAQIEQGPLVRRALDRSGSAFVYAVPVEIASRVWEFQYAAQKNAIISEPDKLLPRLVLASGLLSSVLLFAVLYSLASSRSRAERIASDMTKHLRESEASLAEAHALLNDAQKLARVGCCQYSPADGRVIWSEELYRIYGVDPRVFTPTYESFTKLVHPEDRAAWEKSLATALRNREAFTAEFRIVRPDGTVRHLRSLGEVIAGGRGGATRMLWSILDITEQKEIEHALRGSADQLTALSRRLVDVQEAERRKLSRELHDRVGQNLTALSINLDILKTSLGADTYAEQRARINDSSRLLESTVESIENVMAELRPPMLDDYGLLPALQWYARDFSKRTGIEVRVAGRDERDRLAPEIEITLFRVAQEALTNVAKHAHASNVDIALDHADHHCVMTVTDNGVGIVSARERGGSRPPRLGMVTMRERAQAIGGRFEVHAVREGGTQIAISIPWPSP
jgi:signal transduction histidine kinase